MKTVKKKTWPEYFEKILNGSKTYELRVNNFEIEEGDILLLEEWDPKTKEYTGRSISKRVGFIGKWDLNNLDEFGQADELKKHGFQIISLRDK